MQYKCEICEKEFSSLWGLSSHSVQKHNTKPEELYIKYELNGEPPKCKCGCDGSVKFLGIKKGFTDYILGHASRVHNNWGHNQTAQKKSKDTQREKYKSGELVVWNKGLTIEDPRVKTYVENMLKNSERGKKISESLKGKKRPKEVLEKLHKGMNGYWSKEVNREKQSNKRLDFIRKNGLTPISKVEISFGVIMDLCEIQYYTQFYVKEIKALFDFKIKGRKILIEVDGDFWHCNTNKGYQPVYESQKSNLIKDEIKNVWCEKNGYLLLRFWESDINEKPEWVMEQLKQYLV